MLPLEMDRTHDRDRIVRERFEDHRRTFLRSLVTPEVIEEHRANPLGQHSEPLERLLLYFRQMPNSGKYVIKVVEPFKDYRIVALSGQRGILPLAVDDTHHASASAAYHALFVLFVRDLIGTD